MDITAQEILEHNGIKLVIFGDGYIKIENKDEKEFKVITEHYPSPMTGFHKTNLDFEIPKDIP